MNRETIYLDHAATTPVHPDALAAMLPCFGYHYGNAGSPHSLGKRALSLIEEARSQTASMIGADPEEIVFTSGGTEADNLAIKGAALANESKGRHIITCATEHHAVLKSCEWLEDRGFSVTYLPVDPNGIVSTADIEKAITKDTILISIMHANNETGAVQPIEEIGSITRNSGILFHTDAIQSLGKIPFRTSTMNADLVSISSHKIYGPKGVGVLYARKGTALAPLLSGGGQERSLRSGTENVTGIVGFGRACSAALNDLDRNIIHVKSLRDYLEQMLAEKLPDLRINGSRAERLPNISSISFDGIDAAGITAALDAHGIYASAGAACSAKSVEPSHVLTAMRVPPEMLYGTIRLSLGWENTEEQILKTVDVICEAVQELRNFSEKKHTDISFLQFSDAATTLDAKSSIGDKGIDCIFLALPHQFSTISASDSAVAVPHSQKAASLKTLSDACIEPVAVHDIKGIGKHTMNSLLSQRERSFWKNITGT